MSSVPTEIGGYRIVGKLGEGGMGAVFRAEHPRFPGRLFALKLLLEVKAEALGRFGREVEALKLATAHPNIVRIFGGATAMRLSGSGENQPFIVMELVQGKPLDAFVPLEPRRAAKIVRDVADAIAFIHAQGIFHRDLKPGNILVEEGDRPRVCDFGLAKLVDHDRLTQSGVVLGTPAYAPPEQLDGRAHQVDARADVYGLGAVLWHALAGAAPFRGSQAALLKAVLLDMPAPPSSLQKSVPPELDAICWKCLAKEAPDRYASAAELRDELDRFLRGEAIVARTPTRRERFRWWRRRHRRMLGVVSVLFLLFLVALALVVKKGIEKLSYDRDIAEALAKVRDRSSKAADLNAFVTRARELEPEDPRTLELARLVLERELDERLVGVNARTKPAALLALTKRARPVAATWPSVAALGEILVDTVALLDEVDEGIAIVVDGRTIPLSPDKLVGAYDESQAARADSKALLAEALELVRGRLAVNPNDLGVRAVRARVALGPLGFPVRALGRGRFTAKLPAGALDDLAGDPELRADLLVGSGASERETRAAVAKLPAGRVRAILERVLQAPETLDERAAFFSEEREKLAKGGDVAFDAALVLSRFLARIGCPRALEAPELIRGGLAAIKAAANRDPPGSFDYPVRKKRDDARESYDFHSALKEYDPPARDNFLSTDRGSLAKEMQRRRERRVRNLDPRIAALIRTEGLETSSALQIAGRPIRGLAGAPFDVLWARRSGVGSFRMFEFIDRGRREATRGGGANIYYYEEDWETEKSGRAACDELDGRLARALAVDAPANAARTNPDFEPATRIVRALFRLEQLEREDANPAELGRLVLDAFELFEASAELPGGPGERPFRARLEKIAFPGELGENLALLEMVRIYRAAARCADPGIRNAELLLGLAGRTVEADEKRELPLLVGRQLWSFGCALAREEAILQGWKMAQTSSADAPRDPAREAASDLDSRRQIMQVGGDLHERLQAYGTDEVRSRTLALTTDDERRARMRMYAFQHPLAKSR